MLIVHPLCGFEADSSNTALAMVDSSISKGHPDAALPASTFECSSRRQRDYQLLMIPPCSPALALSNAPSLPQYLLDLISHIKLLALEWSKRALVQSAGVTHPAFVQCAADIHRYDVLSIPVDSRADSACTV